MSRLNSKHLRPLIAVFALAAVVLPRGTQASDEQFAWAALKSGAIVLFRHANAPGGGDPPGMRLDDCTTQRNLDDAGRAQARRIGAAFRERSIAVGRVLTSRWCRAAETAELAFPGRAIPEPAFDSIHADRNRGPAQGEAARRILLAWNGPGALVVTTHQFTIMAIVDLPSTSGEGIVLRRSGDKLVIVGSVKP
ncbi:MAG: histidine phosphatase family protein [Rhodospirillales bacterium]|nr:histidine phosphatase family protein [Rhodospirillales bacterium]